MKVYLTMSSLLRFRLFICYLRNGVLDVSTTASISSLLCITVDRYIAIIHPLHYPMIMTTAKANIFILISWLFSVALNIPAMVLWHNSGAPCFIEAFLNKYHLLAKCIVNFIIQCIIVIVYAKISRTILHHRRQIAAQQQTGQESQLASSVKAAIKTLKLFVLVFGAMFICITPSDVSYTYLAMARIVEAQQSYPAAWVMLCVDMLLFLNSTLNPIIYAWKYKDFRGVLVKMFTCSQGD
ncbi:PREDICTED: lysophosphatidic acid receptor 3-like [Priapulus caudatus]|uniref:Lysophosphatidic acid receptor 3-like n=1 Tax=Priapulus caudatus TaxID=37621 RepID=A0ABM1DQJ7_PRICU|nr:PREDICTED: lysophosphatidic acid receptor 3-like [Priapulus caudatus]